MSGPITQNVELMLARLKRLEASIPNVEKKLSFAEGRDQIASDWAHDELLRLRADINTIRADLKAAAALIAAR